MSFSGDSPLSRIANETIKANTALMDYWLMGAGRSLEKLRKSYVKSPSSNEPPSVHLRTLQKWSSRHHWQARIAQQAANDNALALAQYQERHMGGDEALALISDIARGDMGDFADVLSLADLAKLDKSRLVKKATFHHSSSSGTITGRLMIDLHDSQKALELILRHHGAFEKDNKSELSIKLAESPLDKINRALDSIAANVRASELDKTQQNINPQKEE